MMCCNYPIHPIHAVVLKALASLYLCKAHPGYNEGQLSVEKARLVRNYSLAQRAEAVGLQRHVRLAAFDPQQWGPEALVAAFGDSREVRCGLAWSGVVVVAWSCGLGPSDRMQRHMLAVLLIDTTDDLPRCPPPQSSPATHPPAQGQGAGRRVEALIGAAYLTASGPQSGAAAGPPAVARGLQREEQLCINLGVLPADAHNCADPPTLPPPQPPASAAAQGAADYWRRVAASDELRALLGGYSFRRPELLGAAFTHVSVPGAESYQRLEFQGGESAPSDGVHEGWKGARLDPDSLQSCSGCV